MTENKNLSESDATDEGTSAGTAQPGIVPEDVQQLQATAEPSLLWEFLCFLREHKAWWMTPIVLALLLAALVIQASGSGALPFIYALF